ncbi:ClC family H(+)/Cl(-) exchange transporter, partial [Intestinibacter bartlettii]
MKHDHAATRRMLSYGELKKYQILAESLIVGLIVGLVIVLHRIILSSVFSLFKNFYSLGRENFVYIPAIFAVLIFLGYIVGKSVKIDPMITGSGIPQVEGILLRKLKQKWYSVLVLKFVSGLVCLGTGLSLGREGPSVQIGSCVGEGFAESTKKMDNEKKYFITCGASAGLAAAFNAPMAGVMFSLEEAHKNFSPIVLLSAISASLAADFASKNFFGLKPSLNFQQLSAMPLKYYWALLILGIVIGISGTIFNKGLLVSQILYKKTNLSIEMKCIIPFIVTGIVGLTVPALLGGGHDLIMSLQNLNIHMELLIAYIIIKFIFTFVCFGSGAPGGIFFPLLTLGSLVGDFVGIIMVTYFNIPQEYLL